MTAPPGEVVSWFGAMQAQEYQAALWALGQRTAGATLADIEAAIAEGSVLRTHIYRGTLQFVSRHDVRWMLDLVGERIIRSSASRYRELELDEGTLRRCGERFARALEEGAHLTRDEMALVLERGGQKGLRGRLMHILGHAELSQIIVSGARRGRQPTFALLSDRAPTPRRLEREEALAELARRYFQSRGPATIRDFTWWTGLPLRDARLAIELAGASLQSRAMDGVQHWMTGGRTARKNGTALLLPAFDEYLVSYADRSAVLDPAYGKRVNAGGGILKATVVIGGEVVGTWRRTMSKGRVAVELQPFARLDGARALLVRRTARRYADFLGLRLASG